MLALFTVLFALYLGVALMTSKVPGELERRVVMLSFCLLTPAFISQGLPPPILTVLTLYFALYLRAAW